VRDKRQLGLRYPGPGAGGYCTSGIKQVAPRPRRMTAAPPTSAGKIGAGNNQYLQWSAVAAPGKSSR
jgi:hypothetical protein